MFSKNKKIYLDHAATTPLDPIVFAKMKPYFENVFYNPSALYEGAVDARKAIERAREDVADILSTQPDTVIFTSGGTESCNLAILGLLKDKEKGHIITTKIEHHAVLQPIKKLEESGWEVTYLEVDESGIINLEEFKKALRPDTVLVSVMYANNEVGSIQPIADIGREILKWRKNNNRRLPYFHTDACQAGAYLDLKVEKFHVDLLTLNGSKIYGPKGSGILYKRRSVEIGPIMYGGGQEFGLRPGTENVAGIIGFAEALRISKEQLTKNNRQILELRNYFWDKLKLEIKNIKLNGPELGESRLANNLNIMFENIDSEELIIRLSESGIMCSSGSACTTDSDEVSHVLLACGLSEKEARQSIRFTLGKGNTKSEIDYTVKKTTQLL